MTTRREFLQTTAAAPFFRLLPIRNEADVPYVHLHVHSEYSYPHAIGRVVQLVERARRLGMNALALTDRGNLSGAIHFYQACRKAGLKPIIGYEAAVAVNDRHVCSNAVRTQHSVTLLAQNQMGFQNLIRLSSAGYREGRCSSPQIDQQLLASHSKGLVCLSGFLDGEPARLLLRGQAEAAQRTATSYRELFGDRYFIEVRNHRTDIERQVRDSLVRLAERIGVPVVASHDVSYTEPEDYELHRLVINSETDPYQTSSSPRLIDHGTRYLRSPHEMYAAFVGLEQAVRRSQEIADSIDLDLEFGTRHFPTCQIPESKTAPDYLRDLCLAGLKECYADEPALYRNGELQRTVVDRLNRELDVINTLGFADYFLVAWDCVRFAIECRIPYSARGSVVSSLVAYGLKLSHVCPIKYNLLFERFLDVGRRESPAISIDFCKDRRIEVVNYVRQKYGTENVAQIGMFGTFPARAAIRNVGGVMGMPIPRVDAVVAMIPERLGITLADALQQNSDLKQTYENDPEVNKLLDMAQKIEGMVRNVGTQTAAVVIADRPLVEYVPLRQGKDKEEVITQWSMNDVERFGLLKLDFLGLRNLTVLARTVDLIEQSTGTRIDPYKFPLDDAKTFGLLSRGDTKGVFQLESSGLRDLLQRLKPDHFRELIAINALYRPNPLEAGMIDEYIPIKLGRKQARYLHPVMKDVLEETYGVMVYQEQVMQILNRLGGIELVNAYACVQAINKKKLETITQYRDEFLVGAKQQGLTGPQAVNLFQVIEKFAGRTFNKSHSTAYALIAYMTAYLKANYPAEFMAAFLKPGDRGWHDRDGFHSYVAECQGLGINITEDGNDGFSFRLTNGEVVGI